MRVYTIYYIFVVISLFITYFFTCTYIQRHKCSLLHTSQKVCSLTVSLSLALCLSLSLSLTHTHTYTLTSMNTTGFMYKVRTYGVDKCHVSPLK